MLPQCAANWTHGKTPVRKAIWTRPGWHAFINLNLVTCLEVCVHLVLWIDTLITSRTTNELYGDFKWLFTSTCVGEDADNRTLAIHKTTRPFKITVINKCMLSQLWSTFRHIDICCGLHLSFYCVVLLLSIYDLAPATDRFLYGTAINSKYTTINHPYLPPVVKLFDVQISSPV